MNKNPPDQVIHLPGAKEKLQSLFGMTLHFFETPSELRTWFSRNHVKSDELWVGYYKRSSGKKSLTWDQSVEEALCYGWIDGVRMSVDDESYTIRFTPRRPGSTWSQKNIRTAEKLIRSRRIRPAGLAAFQKRKESRSGIYAYEREKTIFNEDYERRLKENDKAWAFFNSQAPSYQRTVRYWIMDAKQEETRQKRLRELIADSSMGRKVKPFRSNRSRPAAKSHGDQHSGRPRL